MATGAAGLALGLPGAASAANTSVLEGYACATTVKKGGTLDFCVRDPGGSMGVHRQVQMSVARLGYPVDKLMFEVDVGVRNCAVPADASQNGCGWPVTYQLNVPVTWPSGVYYAVFGVDDNACAVPFVVASVQPAPGTRVLVQVPVNTSHAYNNYGGKSLYGFNSTGGQAATQVSFDRPFTDPWNIAFTRWQAALVRWLAKNKIAADYCTNVDLHQNPNVLNGYQLLITAGHDEYWSRDMRNRVDAFVSAGGNVAVFSGNTCWWQIRMAPNAAGTPDRTLVCHKSATADPDPRPAYKTVNWVSLQPPEPENSTIGLGFSNGASWTNSLPRPPTSWVVQRGSHWAFAGTGMPSGTSFGAGCVGYEVDALNFRLGADGLAYPTCTDASPGTLTILGLADATQWDAQAQALGLSGEKPGWGAISVFSRGNGGGTVFNAGTCDWVVGLKPELDGQPSGPISRITTNVINRLSMPCVETVDVRRHAKRQANGDGTRYYFTAGQDAPADCALDGWAFRAFISPASGTVPIYRFRYPQVNGDGERHNYSLLPVIGNGWIPDGVAFHAYNWAKPGALPVYKHHAVQANGDGWRFLLSLRSVEPTWIPDGIAFYAPPA